jgi:cell division protein FtsI (penicillin-binding protein 3)
MGKGIDRKVRRRILSVACVLTLCGGAILARLYFLQVVYHQKLSSRADSQICEEIRFSPRRGDICDRNGRKLAANVEVDSLYGVPFKVEDPAGTAQALSRITGGERNHFLRQLKKDSSFVWLQRRLSPAKVSRIRELDIAGLGFIKENRRYYPQRDLAAQIVGLAGIDNQGLEGVELAFDGYLQREAVYLAVEKDARGKDIILSGLPEDILSEGVSVRLTLDETVQFMAQEELARGVKEAGAKGGSIVVMDPGNGEILAMANLPYFNPNEFHQYGPSYFRNRAISDLVEPGSIMKPVLLAAALEEGAVNLDTLFFCENGAMSFMGRTLHDVHPNGYLDAAGVIRESSNIGATKMALKLGPKRYSEYLKKFGFGQKSGVNIPGESPGMLRPLSQWSGLSISALAIGQELSVTPLQMAAAFSALVNGGDLYRPLAAREIVDASGRVVKNFPPTKVRRVMSTETSRKVRGVMVQVVENGTGVAAAVEGYKVGGKTGTAQKYDRASRSYSNDKYLAAFAGFAPAEEPRLVVIVMIDEPEVSIWGGSVAAPVFRRVVSRALRYLNVPATEGGRTLVVQS